MSDANVDNKGLKAERERMAEFVAGLRRLAKRTQAESAQLNPTNPSPTPHTPSSAQ